MFSIESILAMYKEKNYIIDKRINKVNILGIRNNIDNTLNKFDDYIVTFYKKNDTEWIVNTYNATTDPGKYYLNNLLNRNGTAILIPGQYVNAYSLGLHQGKYKALKQVGNVSVWRDRNKDDTLDYGKNIYTGLFGINIHRASLYGISSYVGKYSAGCQVIQNPEDFNQFIHDLEMADNTYSDHYYNYTLCNYTDLIQPRGINE